VTEPEEHERIPDAQIDDLLSRALLKPDSYPVEEDNG